MPAEPAVPIHHEADILTARMAAFPPGVPIRRVPLDQAIAHVEERLSAPAANPVELAK